MNLAEKRERLLEQIASYESAAVAFSAGVDSTVLAKAAQLALDSRAVAVTGVSVSLAESEREDAQNLADVIGIRHVWIDTNEMQDENYLQNDPNRCYHCRSELYTQIERILPELKVNVILNGANADDADDYRPGTRAATEHKIRSPLADCGFTKDDVRALAAEWKLPIWDKPAMPCLASRLAYGEEVTSERLTMINAAEVFLRSKGYRTVRVRYHRGDVARLEVPADNIASLCADPFRTELISKLKEIGFRFVSVDLEGFRSGSLNTMVPVEMLAAN